MSTANETSTEATGDDTSDGPVGRGAVVGWAFYDWGMAAFNAVIVTFVFSVYLTDAVGADVTEPLRATTWLSIAVAGAGVVIALTAPVMGQRADRAGRRKRSVGFWTVLTLVVMVGMAFVRDEASYLWLGLLLLAAGSVTFQFAEVGYFAMLKQVSRPATVGRVSGFGWGMGYFGGIFLLLICYVGFIAGEGETRGLLELSTEGGFNIRMLCLFAAGWFAVFAIPLFFSVPEVGADEAREEAARRSGFVESYRLLFADLRDLWRADRRTVFFLGASAVFRDGLAGVFTFGAILAVSVYEIDSGDVLIFGIAANVVAALGAVAAGFADDLLGPKLVIVVSLASMLVVMGVLFVVSGPTMFWVFGLALCFFVGPAQSASRSYLARLTPRGREGQMFGLYATTGRAVSFLAPAMFGLFVWIGDADRWGILGIGLVIGAGLALLLPVRAPREGAGSDEGPGSKSDSEPGAEPLRS